jgi:hypothetical protein
VDANVGIGSPDHLHDFELGRCKIMKVIDFNNLEHDMIRKRLHTFRHHALATAARMAAMPAALNL